MLHPSGTHFAGISTQPPYTRRKIVIFKSAKFQICANFCSIGAIAQKNICVNLTYVSTHAADLPKKNNLRIKKSGYFFCKSDVYRIHIDACCGFTLKIIISSVRFAKKICKCFAQFRRMRGRFAKNHKFFAQFCACDKTCLVIYLAFLQELASRRGGRVGKAAA